MGRGIMIIFLSFMLLGCSNTRMTSSEVSEEIKPKKYDTPAIEFLYPANLFPKPSANGNVIFCATSIDPDENINNLTYNELRDLIVINVVQKHANRPINSEELRKIGMEDIKELGRVEFIDTKTLLQDNIPVLEFIVSNPQTSLHMKQYFHANEGEEYVISISTSRENWPYINSTIAMFEKSIKFKRSSQVSQTKNSLGLPRQYPGNFVFYYLTAIQ
ncbi:hypothetical protein Desca_1422 [Desulfotomaculum nigrificans CO-1-SRB]|uniref:Lipoprotein n=1 Tax=Desulfotomaculum nigrificans (strain DSM 14880 / VKM B-2319 / CO-1-SRB) TaxID=868595 RepID=F6B5F7_DESCC|nr:hypothetical protein [Desulfotomaculum nigrificans]AEF94278.1 hypothetical protein Desca_1422 [Desulfotomaculum nigrificans CO-1-SRB]